MDFRSYVDALERQTNPGQWPYIVALRACTFERERFVRSQVQFRHAVRDFVEPMELLVGRLPAGPARAALLQNITDERGGGDPTRAHPATFAQLLSRLGVSVGALPPDDQGDAVRTFNQALLTTCAEAPPHRGLAALGMIERIFASVSAWIGGALVRCGWMAPDEVTHYATHETLDLEHAESFFAPIEPAFPVDPEVRIGLDQGAELFRALYAGLWAEA